MRPRSPLCLRQLAALPQRRPYSSDHTVKEFDVLLLRQRGSKYSKWHLTAPLRHDSRVKLSYGASIHASDLIGRRALDRVRDSKGRDVILHEPTLGGYILQSARLATPIYPHDANTIVALLDLNPSRPGEEGEDEGKDGDEERHAPFEVFEAGTGMGSLTLHIARALHAANPPVPPSLRRALLSSGLKTTSRDDGHENIPASTANNSENGDGDQALTRPPYLTPEDQVALDRYRASRRAILHTLDHNARHARAAYKLIRNFRRAQYLPTVDFHPGRSIAEVLEARLAASASRPFLSAAVLDLPDAPSHAGPVVRALRRGALLVVFNPSLSQIAEVDEWARRSGQPLRLEKVIELAGTTRSDGGNVHVAAGGREWDLRRVVPKADDGGEGRLVQVMRPKVGDRVGGGGFVGVWRRWPGTEVLEDEARADEEETADAAEENEDIVEEKVHAEEATQGSTEEQGDATKEPRADMQDSGVRPSPSP